MTKRPVHKWHVARTAHIGTMPTTLGTANAELARVDEVLRKMRVSYCELLVIADKARQRAHAATVRRAQNRIAAMSISFINLSRVRDDLMSVIEDLTMLTPASETQALLDDLFERLTRKRKPNIGT